MTESLARDFGVDWFIVLLETTLCVTHTWSKCSTIFCACLTRGTYLPGPQRKRLGEHIILLVRGSIGQRRIYTAWVWILTPQPTGLWDLEQVSWCIHASVSSSLKWDRSDTKHIGLLGELSVIMYKNHSLPSMCLTWYILRIKATAPV